MRLRFSLMLVCIIAGCICAGAQEKLQNDADIKVGKLENGLTYYLRHNSNPKGCADFYIAHNVGALQEDDNQNGLAHFLEHMAFNGTKHYPDKKLLEFLAKDGVRFGYNVNAYTSRFETVYNLSDIPLARESFVDSVMLILHDWSCNISCEQEALDAERGVISEEWRRRDEVRSRMAMATVRATTTLPSWALNEIPVQASDFSEKANPMTITAIKANIRFIFITIQIRNGYLQGLDQKRLSAELSPQNLIFGIGIRSLDAKIELDFRLCT